MFSRKDLWFASIFELRTDSDSFQKFWPIEPIKFRVKSKTYLLLGGNGEVEHDGLGGPVEPEGAPPGEGTSNVMGRLGETSLGLSRRPPLLLTEGTYLGDDTAIGRLWGPLPPSTASKNSCNIFVPVENF